MKISFTGSHDEVVVRVACFGQQKYLWHFLIFNLHCRIFFALYFLAPLRHSVLWTAVVAHHPVEVHHCLVQPHKKYVLQYDVLEKSQPEICLHLNLNSLLRKCLHPVHHAFLHLLCQVPKQALYHPLAPVKSQVQLVEITRNLVNRHICLVMLLDIFESFRQYPLDILDNIRNWLFEMGPEKLLNLQQFLLTNLLEILLVHLFALFEQVQLESTQLNFFYSTYLLQAIWTGRLLTMTLLRVRKTNVMGRVYLRKHRWLLQTQAIHWVHNVFDRVADFLATLTLQVECS